MTKFLDAQVLPSQLITYHNTSKEARELQLLIIVFLDIKGLYGKIK